MPPSFLPPSYFTRHAEIVREDIAIEKGEEEQRKKDERKREFAERKERLKEAKKAAEEALLRDVDAAEVAD